MFQYFNIYVDLLNMNNDFGTHSFLLPNVEKYVYALYIEEQNSEW